MPTADRLRRAAAVALLVVAAAAAGWGLFATPAGRAVRHDPRRVGGDARAVVADHPVAAPVGFLAVYLGLSVLCLPVWWLQVLAGVAFGLWAGGGLCVAGSAFGATATAALADWFAGPWFHGRIETKAARLRWLDQAMGNHGLLTVMAIRLTHLVPFGLSNVALGLSEVPTAAVFVGTLIGNVPAVAAYVGLGAGVAGRWPFAVAVVGLNVALLAPSAVVAGVRWRRAVAGRPSPGV